jgi:hypothetical protein
MLSLTHCYFDYFMLSVDELILLDYFTLEERRYHGNDVMVKPQEDFVIAAESQPNWFV